MRLITSTTSTSDDPRTGGMLTRRKLVNREVDPNLVEISSKKRNAPFPQVISSTIRSKRRSSKSEVRQNGLPVHCRVLPSILNQFVRKDLEPIRNCFTTPARLDNSTISRPGPVQPRPLVILTKPPRSGGTQPRSAEIAIQTDDKFDIETAVLVEELAVSAISCALKSLQKDDEIEQLRQKVKTTEQQLVALGNTCTALTAEESKMIETLRAEQLKSCHQLAAEICQGITSSSMYRLRQIEQSQLKTRSVGTDTRTIGRTKRLGLLTVELQEDFFPWIFAKADRMFQRAMTSIQLENMMVRRSSFKRKAKFAKT
ncbi:hypothetical protein Q1695_010471 [Nippostrongylus brasiliensis]|nr:hypothetical protein Q1695_010471 [Nippostrongylus brasiliensis]